MAQYTPEELERLGNSLTGRALWHCGFDSETGVLDDALAAVIAREQALADVPQWAQDVIARMIAQLPMCGHYTFPAPILVVCRAIALRQCPETVCGHYTCDFGRKTLMCYYVFCLDAWLQGAPPELAKAEYALRDSLGKDWPAIVDAVYGTLGEHSEVKDLLVARLVHRERWWIKTLIWPDDKRDRFMLDVYGGDVRGDEAQFGAYGNSPYGDPYFAELRLPRVAKMAQQIRDAGHGELLECVEHSHLCGPKAFRILEKLIWAIGNLDRPPRSAGDVSILQCEDTYPSMEACAEWFRGFMSGLDAWLAGDASALPELGPVTEVSLWPASALRYHLNCLARRPGNPLSRLVGTSPGGKGGTRPLHHYLASGGPGDARGTGRAS